VSEWRVKSKEAGIRLLQFLREHCAEAPSVKAIKRAIEFKRCTVNGQIVTFSSRVLKENDLVVLSKGAFQEKEKETAKILFEDKDLLILNKPPDVVSDIRSLCALFPHHKSLHLVHRLDKETSGALLLAKTEKMKEEMIDLFKKREIHKVYLALVDGVVSKEEGKIDNYLGVKHAYQGQTIYGSVDPKKGKRAITLWKCLKRGKNVSLLLCDLHTGRTHQLRAHLSGMGHPILGDVQYGKRFRSELKPERHLLHAYEISFSHPRTGEKIHIKAPIPSDFKKILEKLDFD